MTLFKKSKNTFFSKTVQGILIALVGFLASKGWVPIVDPELFVADTLQVIGYVWAYIGRHFTKGEKIGVLQW